jgi:ferrochelatase
VVIFNLGGPDQASAIKPFLFNLFHDRAIIDYPNPIRWIIAKLISSRRAPVAKQIYDRIGGGSPIVRETQKQAQALQDQLNRQSDDWDHQVVISMRYWHPFADEAAQKAADFLPDEIVLLPLYPQFSTTTTKTGFLAWDKAARAIGLDRPTRRICCYPTHEGWVKAQCDLIGPALQQNPEPLRVLFSAHGLPEKIVNSGDPYPGHVAMGAQAIADKLALAQKDWIICYQSRVGPLAWIGPSLDDELRRAAEDGVGVVVVPVSFVSEHAETLVELDMEYKKVAEDMGIHPYIRLPVVGIASAFIEGLADMVEADRGTVCTGVGTRRCTAECTACPLAA